jgi:hypothetical protein
MSTTTETVNNTDIPEDINTESLKILLTTYLGFLKDLVKKFVVIVVGLFIVLNLFIRSKVPGEVLYPHNTSKMPYVEPCETPSSLEEIDGNKVCKTTKLVDTFNELAGYNSNSIFNFAMSFGGTGSVDQKEFNKQQENLATSINMNKYQENDINKVFGKDKMYIHSWIYQNILSSGTTSKGLGFIYSPLFIALATSMKSQALINSILSSIHDSVFSKLTSSSLLLFIMSIILISIIDNVSKKSENFNFMNEFLKLDPENNDHSILTFLTGLIFNVFSGFIFFMSLFLKIIPITVLLVSIINLVVLAGTKLGISCTCALMAILTIMNIEKIITLMRPEKLNFEEIKKELIAIPFPTFMFNGISNQFTSGVSGAGSFIGKLFKLIPITLFGYLSFMSTFSILTVGILTSLTLAYELGLKFLFNGQIRKMCMCLVKDHTFIIKVLFAIFSIELIRLALGEQALLLSIFLFTLFFLADMFGGNKSNEQSDDVLSQLITKNLNCDEDSDYNNLFKKNN